MKKSNNKKLIDTNPYLKDRQYWQEVCLRNTSATCHIEGVYCKNIDKELKHYLSTSRKPR
ncbi:MAG: hypothetical protein AAB019_12345 [Planctomycetota bacterium]